MRVREDDDEGGWRMWVRENGDGGGGGGKMEDEG